MSDLVSIITPSYNSSKFISQTIESVLAQTYTNWEMVIIDDCSNDGSLEIVNEYKKNDGRIKLIKLEKNSGAAIARNRGIREAKGRYIAFLDADDLWVNSKLEKQVSFMKNKGAFFCYSSYFVIDKSNEIISMYVIPKLEVSYKELLKSNIIGNLTAIYDAGKIGKQYMENVVGHEDYTLWLKILKNIDKGYGIQELLAYYRVYNESKSSKKYKSAIWQWNIYRKIEKLSFTKSIYYFMNYAYNGIKKYRK